MGIEEAKFWMCSLSFLSFTTTSRSGSPNGSARKRTAFTTLKIAVVAPIPSASVSTAAAANMGVLLRVRTA